MRGFLDKKNQIVAISNQLDIPHNRRELWLELWKRLPKSSWASIARQFEGIVSTVSKRTYPPPENLWCYLEKRLKKIIKNNDHKVGQQISDTEWIEDRLFAVEKKQLLETEELDRYDYKILIEAEKWELHRAICYLLGYTVLGHDTFSKNCSLEGIRYADAKLKLAYRLIIKANKNDELVVEGNIEKYSLTTCLLIRGAEQCFVSPYEFLKWSLLNNFYLPIELQWATGLFLYEKSPYSKNHLAGCSTIQFYRKSNNWNEGKIMDKLACQSIAQVLWYLDPSLTNTSIQKTLKKNSYFQSISNAHIYTGKDTIWSWIKSVDPRKNAEKGRLRFCSIDGCFSWFMYEEEFKWYAPAYSFKKFKHVIFCSVLAFLYKNKSITKDEMFAHQLIQQYLGLKSSFLEKMIKEWIDMAFSLKMRNI